ncbi:hypothetical protein K1719_036349 [Acacia pycnantha]|nr:hypothetical protein K1719_036349 [Acacia pycnantha]
MNEAVISRNRNVVNKRGAVYHIFVWGGKEGPIPQPTAPLLRLSAGQATIFHDNLFFLDLTLRLPES